MSWNQSVACCMEFGLSDQRDNGRWGAKWLASTYLGDEPKGFLEGLGVSEKGEK